MKIFLDTANLDEIRNAQAMGLLDGVTTNPSLIAKENANFERRIIEICETVQGPVSAEVTCTDADGMFKQLLQLSMLSPHVVVKAPITRDGLRAGRRLIQEGIRVNATPFFLLRRACWWQKQELPT